MIRLALAAVALAALGGCAAHRTHSADPVVEGSHPITTSAAAICRDAFAHDTVLGWTRADVAELRAYQYGGPVPHVPLRVAFAGVSAAARGAWCLVREGPESSSLWGAVPGHHPQRAITVTGPGSGRHVGEMHRPPVVP